MDWTKKAVRNFFFLKSDNERSLCFSAQNLANFNILVGNQFDASNFDPAAFSTCANEAGPLSAETTQIECDQTVTGRYLAVQLEDANVLTLCEVQVFPPGETSFIFFSCVQIVCEEWFFAKHVTDETAICNCLFSDRENLALGKPALLDNGRSSDASKAVDGNPDPDSTNGLSCATTNAPDSNAGSTDPPWDPWWAVNLGSDFAVGTVAITNPGDCCGNSLPV